MTSIQISSIFKIQNAHLSNNLHHFSNQPSNKKINPIKILKIPPHRMIQEIHIYILIVQDDLWMIRNLAQKIVQFYCIFFKKKNYVSYIHGTNKSQKININSITSLEFVCKVLNPTHIWTESYSILTKRLSCNKRSVTQNTYFHCVHYNVT